MPYLSKYIGTFLLIYFILFNYLLLICWKTYIFKIVLNPIKQYFKINQSYLFFLDFFLIIFDKYLKSFIITIVKRHYLRGVLSESIIEIKS